MTALSNAQQEAYFLVINENTCTYFAFKQKKKARYLIGISRKKTFSNAQKTHRLLFKGLQTPPIGHNQT